MRSSFWPLFGDEAQDNPATSKYLTLMEDHGGKIALLARRRCRGGCCSLRLPGRATTPAI